MSPPRNATAGKLAVELGFGRELPRQQLRGFELPSEMGRPWPRVRVRCLSLSL